MNHKTVRQWLEELPDGLREKALRTKLKRPFKNDTLCLDAQTSIAMLNAAKSAEGYNFWFGVAVYLKGGIAPFIDGGLDGYRFAKQCYEAQAKEAAYSVEFVSVPPADYDLLVKKAEAYDYMVKELARMRDFIDDFVNKEQKEGRMKV